MMGEFEMIGLVVSALAVVVGLLIAVGKVIAKNTKATTELTCAIVEMKDDMKDSKTHDKEQDDILSDHEVRIVRLETRGEK